MLGVSHAVEVLVLCLLVVCKIPYSSCIFNTTALVVVATDCSVIFLVSPDVVVLDLSILFYLSSR